MRTFCWLILVLSILLSACSLVDSDGDPESEATQIPAFLTPLPSPTPPVTPQVVEPVSTGPTVLNIWLITELNPQSDLPGSAILAEQLATFQTNRPNVVLDISVKAASGQGGALSYLRSGRNVAPSIMPDLVVISADLLAPAAAEQLIYPLGNLVADDSLADLYPAAASLAKVGDLTFGFPYVLNNLTHLAYGTAVYTGTLPTTWDDLLEDEAATFTFPGAGLYGAELTLQMYLANGGSLTNESGQPMLELDPLANALTLLLEGREQELLPIQTANITALDEAWQLFNNGVVNSVQTIYSAYPAESEDSVASGYTGLPGPEAPLAPMVKSWIWAVSTPDPGRQILAADLLNWLVAAPNMGDFTSAAGKLPSRRTAFEQWPDGDDYVAFLQQELELADPFPYEASGPILDAVSLAVFDVLSLAKTPQQAAQDAIANLAP